MTVKEKRLLIELHESYNTVPAYTPLLTHDEYSPDIFLLLDGWAFSHRDMSEGERQILNYYVTCDFIGLSLLTNPGHDFCVTTLTESRVCRIHIKEMLSFFNDAPRLALTICSSLCNQNDLLTEQILRISKRSAYHRTGHFLLELVSRLETITGMGALKNFEFPINQEMLAETLGMTAVHVNRTMRKLKRDELIDYDNKTVTILDRERLSDITEFNDAYIDSRQKTHY